MTSRGRSESESYKLSLSMLNPSLLLTLFTTPNLKYLSSPVAVRPPMYHFSAPLASLNPSLLLSLPLRLCDPDPDPAGPIALRGESTPGDRGCCVWGWGIVLGCDGAVDGPGEVEGPEALVVVVCVEEDEVLFGCWCEGRCWRMEEKKLERKKGRWEDIFGMLGGSSRAVVGVGRVVKVAS